ncbi:11beta-hydroxysteroid dehydrogenase short form-like [Scleropages formosus]|uniref:11-beta-hydroxysteroid dehydrogenase type 2 n=1 Tax=Scleropages formosus TaxID=113540 RepID=A0A0P7V1E8_SCLFO|nr:11beta-hydroxysteroid dehydrogenase short form-like [Scleropages formosus]
MEEFALSFWIYMGVMSMFLGGAVRKMLAVQLRAAPTLLAWLGATVLVERLCSLWLPGALLLGLLGAACCLCAPRRGLPAEGKVLFITVEDHSMNSDQQDFLHGGSPVLCPPGCDSGFGKAATQRLDSLGFEVIASVLDLEGPGAAELRRTCSSRLTLVKMDITQHDDVQNALACTKVKLGLRGLWGLVNNAGVCVNFGDAELSLMTTYRGCMEVNFFGTLSVTKAFLPLVRQAKGRIITVSSPSGEQPFPCLAAYGASKAALSLFIDTLRHELEPWGVKVSTILPASFKTAQTSNFAYWEEQYKKLLQEMSPGLLEEYGEEYLLETKELFQIHAKTASEDLSPVINAITDALTARQPKVRYYAGPGVALMYFIHTYFPTSFSDRFLQRLFVKKKVVPLALRRQVQQQRE